MHSARSPYILVAEDDEDIRTVLAMALQDHFRVATASTGVETLDLVAAEPPDVLVFDWMLSDMSGDELVSRLRAREPGAAKVRLVVMSGLSGVAGLAGQVGAIACAKPCTIDQIVASIRKALAAGGRHGM